MQWAVNERLIEAAPALGIKIKLPDTGGRHTWTDDEIAQFQAHYPIGTKARLALELMLWQGMRRSDVIRVGRQHMKDSETRSRNGRRAQKSRCQPARIYCKQSQPTRAST